MTVELNALNSAVAKVLGLSQNSEAEYFCWGCDEYPVQPAGDWSMLMAAVKVLEEDGWAFYRRPYDELWEVHWAGGEVSTPMQHSFEYDSDKNDEPLALARCIHAVVQEEG